MTLVSAIAFPADPVVPAVPRRQPQGWTEAPGQPTVAHTLLRDGRLAPHDLIRALALHRRHKGHLEDILRRERMVGEAALLSAMSRHFGIRVIDPDAEPPDPRLIDRIGAADCLREGVLPWRKVGPVTVVLTEHPGDAARWQTRLAERLGPVVLAIAPPGRIERQVLALRGPDLAVAAECRLPETDSCRRFAAGPLRVRLGLGLAALGLAAWIAPAAVVAVLLFWTVFTVTVSTALKIAAAWTSRRPLAPAPDPGDADGLPVISVMVPLYREASIAGRLVRRLERLDYPRERLDIVLVVEAEDRLTQDALAAASLPPWMRVVVVPPGTVKTKPRAMNIALDLCRGSIVGVYDAEDAPAPDQLRRVAARFATAAPAVACLQGMLDYYNPRQNWLARCFTLEYAAWFRVLLPGVARLGLPVPLGGTTLFFRRAALEALGAWDAHNVTEDADLGIRLTRRGYLTEVIDTVTMEEANARPVAWVKQRSRWIKGYMVTWAVHMRDPARLWRELGPRGFCGFQVLFLATLSQFLLAPLLWSLWLIALGLPHPAEAFLPRPVLTGFTAIFLVTEAMCLTVGWVGLRRRGGGLSPLWLPTLHLYYPLASMAAYKALWELLAQPFYWDKTAHGEPRARPPHA
jgi:cellulose synthase/poly-beta-1,6-N-acetylglucosamine synthase-like glycosyltransferase